MTYLPNDVTDRAARLLGVVDKGKIWDGTNTAAVSAALALKVDGSAVTQPVSGTFWQATQPVSGTFWQATQPVSIAATVTTDVSDRAARLLGIVDKGKIWDGTNIAAVKAGVIAVAGDNPLVVTMHPSSAPMTAQAVTGTFWQATQPVSAVAMTDRTQKTQITDGTRDGTVKAASTLAVATDTAVVVAVRDAVDVSDRAARLVGRVRLTDDTNLSTVKAGSAAAAAADTALVIGISPQNLPVSAALADATANPTTTLIGGLNEVFGGATWDRQVGNMANVATGDTGAKTASFAGATQTNRTARGAIVTVRLGAVTGTSPTLTAQLQYSPDDGTTWIGLGAISGTTTVSNQTIALIVYPGATGATSGATQTVTINAPLPRVWRLNYVIAGTSPSFTFTAVNVNYIAT